jgi:hypothetical protein
MFHQYGRSTLAHFPSINFIHEKVYEEWQHGACKGGNKSLIPCEHLTKEGLFVCYRQQQFIIRDHKDLKSSSLNLVWSIWA